VPKLAEPTTAHIELTHPEPVRPVTDRLAGAAKRYGVPILILAVLVAAIWAFATMREPSEEGGSAIPTTSYEVDRRTFDLTVLASGELEAKRKLEIKCEVEGGATIVEIVPEGTYVKAGDMLVQLADDEIKNKIEQATLDLERALADQVAAEQMLAIQENQAKTDIEAAGLKLLMAELDLAKWEKGTDPQQKRDLDLALEKAKRTLDRAKEDVELSKTLQAEGFISMAELKDDETALLEAENGLATAELNIKVYADFTRPKELKQMSSAVEQAKAELQRTTSKSESDLERLRADLNSKVRTYKIRKDRHAFLEQQLKNTVVKAPEDGLVVYATSVGPGWRRQQPMAQGRRVGMGENMIILPDTSQMVAAIKVNETLVNQVKGEQTVAVTISGKSAPVTGTVSQVGVTAEDGGWMNPDLREYVVRADLPPGLDATLKPGMRCSGEIFIGRVENAVAVPVQAVFSEGNQRFCYVQKSGALEKKPVKIGRANETYVEVVEGLAGGESVLLRKAKPGEAAKS
jgi:HlyD family secretion protein